MILKQLHNITLKDVILLDATKSANSLKKFWFIPVWLCRKELEKLTGEIFKLIGNSESFSVQDQFDKIMAYQRLQLLDVLYKLVIIEAVYKSKIIAYKILLEKDPVISKQLAEVVDLVFQHTGIKIESPESITELRQYIEHKQDKYNEMFPEPQQDDEKQAVNLTRVVYSVFNYMSEPYNENMRLITFIELKALAEDRIKSQSKSEYDE